MFHIINNREDLDYLCKELAEKTCLGIDTEFKRTSKDNLQLALIQVSDSEEIYIIDCILIGKSDISLNFLSSRNVEKVFHSCREDLEAFLTWTNEKINNIFDTQLANAFLGRSFSISYQDIVKEELGVSISKKETRSNWIRRPLSNSQLNYAASDVQFLLDVYACQKPALINSGKFTWFKEDLNLVTERLYRQKEFSFEESSEKEINKKVGKKILIYFNNLIEDISERKKLNPTLFFSKKNQKDFIDLSMKYGLDNSLKRLTLWRRELLSEPLGTIFKEIC